MPRYARRLPRSNRRGNRAKVHTSCTGLFTSLSQKERSEAVKVYIEKLVKLKLSSPLENHRLERETYKKYYLLLKKVGIDWMTIDALKLCDNRAFNYDLAKSNTMCPPPPGTENNDSLSSHFSSNIHNECSTTKLGRPSGTTFQSKKKLTFAYAEAKNDITKSYYAALKSTTRKGKRRNLSKDF